MLTHTLITDLHDSYLSKLLRMALPQGKDIESERDMIIIKHSSIDNYVG